MYDPTQQFVHQTIKKIIRSFDASLKVHDIRLVTHGEEPKILFDLVLPTESKLSEFELGVEIQRQVYEKLVVIKWKLPSIIRTCYNKRE